MKLEVTLGCAAIVALFACNSAFACEAQNKQIVEAKTRIASYAVDGKFVAEIAGKDVVNKRIAACSELSSSLAQVFLDSGNPVWIDLTEVKLTPPPCLPPTDKIADTHTRPADSLDAVSSGIGSCKK